MSGAKLQGEIKLTSNKSLDLTPPHPHHTHTHNKKKIDLFDNNQCQSSYFNSESKEAKQDQSASKCPENWVVNSINIRCTIQFQWSTHDRNSSKYTTSTMRIYWTNNWVAGCNTTQAEKGNEQSKLHNTRPVGNVGEGGGGAGKHPVRETTHVALEDIGRTVALFGLD